jgi:serine/threonine protein kinase
MVLELGRGAVAVEEKDLEETARHLFGPGSTVGKYSIDCLVARGGMGLLYQAHDRSLGRKVALKTLRQEFDTGEGRARFLREARALAQLSHPNVVAVLEVGEFRSTSYLIMEWIEGVTLKEHLQSRPTLGEVIRCFVQLAEGLAAIHARGLVHRDVKPDNVLVDEAGRCRLVDFGLARPSMPTSTSQDLTAAGIVMGTPAYMAPEQWGSVAIDARADQFSYCVALYEALYRHRPFPGKTLLDLVEAFRTRAVEFNPHAGVPIELQNLLRQGLAFRAEDRFDSMELLVTALKLVPVQNQSDIVTWAEQQVDHDDLRADLISAETHHRRSPLPMTAQARRGPTSAAPRFLGTHSLSANKEMPARTKRRLTILSAILVAIALAGFGVGFVRDSNKRRGHSLATAETAPAAPALPSPTPVRIRVDELSLPGTSETTNPPGSEERNEAALRSEKPPGSAKPAKSRSTGRLAASSSSSLSAPLLERRIADAENKYRAQVSDGLVDPTALAFLGQFRRELSGAAPESLRKLSQRLTEWEDRFLKERSNRD